jgi:hypothetical protein
MLLDSDHTLEAWSKADAKIDFAAFLSTFNRGIQENPIQALAQGLALELEFVYNS